MRLRVIFNISAILLGVIAIIGAFFLMLMTHHQQVTRSEILNSFEISNLARDIELALLHHQRDNYFYQTTQKEKYLQRRLESRLELDAYLAELKRLSITGRQKKLSDSVIKSLNSYLNEYEDLQKTNKKPYDVFSDLSDPAAETHDYIEDLLAYNAGAIEHIRRRILSEEQVAFWMGYILAVFIPLIILGLLLLWRFLIYTPLLRTYQSISTFRDDSAPLKPVRMGATEIKDLSTAFNKLAEHLYFEKQDRQRFLAAVAHDLKNPLASMQMAIEHVVADARELHPDSAKMLEILQRQSYSLSLLVEDLLLATTSRTGNITVELREVDIRRQVKDVVSLQQQSSNKHTIKLNIPEKPVQCLIDPARLGQVVHNLLSNAIKYSPSGGEILVNIKKTETRAHISIVDSGLGISDEDLPFIFDAFHRSNATRSTMNGLGLGLASAKQLTEAMNGSISAHSVLKKGSEFSISFPLLTSVANNGPEATR